MRSAVSLRSSTVKSGDSPRARPWSRSKRFAVAWNVPPQTRPSSRAPAEARDTISRAARRVKVSSRIRSGATPRSTNRATRQARVHVLPEPAPATTRSGPPTCSTAARCSGFSRSKASNMRSSRIGAATDAGKDPGSGSERGRVVRHGAERVARRPDVTLVGLAVRDVDVLVRPDRLVRDLGEQVGDAVQPCALLVVGLDDPPGNLGDVRVD